MSNDAELPCGWITTTLAEVTNATRVSENPAHFPSLPFVGMEHVESETMRLLGHVPSSQLKSSAGHFWHGDILYGRLRPYLNKVVRPDFEGLCSSEFIIFREHERLSSPYLQYFLNTWGFRDFASHLNDGDRPRVDWDQLKDHPFLLPPLAEQNRIVSAIEEQFTRLEAGVAALKRAQARLKRYRAAVLKVAVEGKLTEEWRAANPPTETAPQLLKRILAERQARWESDLRAKGKDPSKVRYEEPKGPGTGRLPELPEGWCWATVEQVSQNVRYGSSAKAATELDGVPILRMGNIKEGSLDFSSLKYLPLEHEEFPSLLLEPGDLLFNRTNSAELVGKSAVYHGVPSPLTFASYLICVRLVKDCSPDYLCYFINSEYGRDWVASVVSQQVGQANVNGSKLQALAYPVPPAAEQLQIVDEVERRLSVVTELESTIDTNLKRAENLRQSILREAFAGRLVRQDPADEPASVLLERIRLERGVTLPRSSPLTTILSRKRKAEETVGSAYGMSVPSVEEYAKVAEAAEAYSASRSAVEAQQLPLLLDGVTSP